MITVSTTKRPAGRIGVEAPYNVAFVRAAKTRGAFWEKPNWLFDGHDEPWVRTNCMKFYGTDGIDRVPVCTLRVTFSNGKEAFYGPVEIHGRPLAIAQSKERGGNAWLGEGVVLEKGEFRRGGTAIKWKTVIAKGTVLLVRDFIRSKTEELQEKHLDLYEIVDEEPVVNLITLSEEKNHLLDRIAEIAALLASAGANAITVE